MMDFLKKLFAESNFTNAIGFLFLIVVVSGAYLLSSFLGSSMEKKQRNSFQKETEKRIRREWKGRKIRRGAYFLLRKVPCLGKVLLRIRNNIYYITPFDDETLIYKTVDVAKMGFLYASLAALGTFLLSVIPMKRVSLIPIVIALVVGATVFEEFLDKYFFSYRDSADEELNSYLAKVKHEYFAHRKVGDAVLKASESMSYDMRVRARDIYLTITRSDADSAVRSYVNNSERSQYLRLFAKQARRAMIGDEWNGDRSLFCTNIDYLRKDIPTERADKKKRRSEFDGYIPSILLPLAMMYLLKSFGKNYSYEMAEFYQIFGYIWEVINIITVLILGGFIRRKRDMSGFSQAHMSSFITDKISYIRHIRSLFSRYKNTRFVKRIQTHLHHIGADIDACGFLCKCFFIGIVGCLLTLSVFTYGHKMRRDALSTSIVYDDFLENVSKYQKEEVNRVFLELLDRFKGTNLRYLSRSQVIDIISNDYGIGNISTIENIADVLLRQVQEYQLEHTQWYETVLSLLALALGLIPYAELLYYEGVVKKAREAEVRMFQLIVLLEKEFETTSISGLLNEFESSAIYFREPLRVAGLMYAKDRVAALNGLYDDECPEFCELVNSLKSAFVCGIRAAFSETELNMLTEGDMHRIDSELSFKKTMDLADILKMVPAAITFGFYFMIPLLSSSLKGMDVIFEILNNK